MRDSTDSAAVSAVFFDIGETVLDRSREYAGWARQLDLSPHTFSAVFGAVVAAGGGVREVLAKLRPDVDPARLQAQLEAGSGVTALTEDDLYPAVRAVLARLQQDGRYVGVVGNQPVAVGEQLRQLGLPADLVATSAELGVRKPEPAFFAELARRADRPASSVLYVGDQLRNDVEAASDAGLAVVRVRTGPWGLLTTDASLEARCLAVIDDLSALPGVLALSRGRTAR